MSPEGRPTALRIRAGVARGLALGAKGGLAAFLLALLVGLVWWARQPTLPEGPLRVGEQWAAEGVGAEASQALELVRDVAGEMGLPSVSVAVSVGGDVTWAAALGTRDLRAGDAATLGTRYRSGSVSKAMTGTLAARLAVDGRVDLDREVRHYLPDLPAKRWPQTLRQLGAHTGGVRHYVAPGRRGFWREQLSKRHYATVGEALELFVDEPLLFEPGTAFQYTTHGYTLLSAALEAAAETQLLELLAEEVWRPCGMTDTRPDDLTQADERRAVPYTRLGGRLAHLEGADPSYKWAGGGILSTPSDLVRMGGALLSGRAMDPAAWRSLTTPVALWDGSANPQGYALGWRRAMSPDALGAAEPVAVLSHGGSSPGGSSFLLLVPEGQVAVAVMTNLSVGDARPLRRVAYRIAGVFRNTPRAPPSESPAL